MEEEIGMVRNATKSIQSPENQDLDLPGTNEVKLITLIQTLDRKIKILEAKQLSINPNSDSCTFKAMCYTAKSKTGTCPCELFR